jgi:hypothetical protein
MMFGVARQILVRGLSRMPSEFRVSNRFATKAAEES